jgi:hypothetical protein
MPDRESRYVPIEQARRIASDHIDVDELIEENLLARRYNSDGSIDVSESDIYALLEAFGPRPQRTT